jgi:ADP-heptose:LPS heptosyltransferase
MIIISPYAKGMRNGRPHPKNYPRWPELLSAMHGMYLEIVQVGIEGEEQLVPDFRKNLSLSSLADLVNKCQTWISVDSFFQHFCWDLKKPGIALFGQSDPLIFGHPENVNLLKSRSYLREKQFWMWEQAEYRPEAFVSPSAVITSLQTLIVN